MLAGFDQPLSAITRAKAAGATTVRIVVPSGDARQRCRRRPAGEPGSPREGEARSPARPRRDGPRRRRLEPCGGSHRARLPCLRTTLKASGVVRLSVGHTYYCPCSNGCGWWHLRRTRRADAQTDLARRSQRAVCASPRLGRRCVVPGRDIVVIGASAGGVEALRDLIARLPETLPSAVMVVLHLGRTTAFCRRSFSARVACPWRRRFTVIPSSPAGSTSHRLTNI